MLDLDLATDAAALDRIARRLAAAIERAVADTLAEARALARDALRQGPRSGRIYRHRDGSPHRASAPGEAPADRTGRLARSLAVTDGALVSDAPYARYLEEGTARMEPRPFIRPAVDEARDELPARVTRALKAEASS